MLLVRHLLENRAPPHLLEGGATVREAAEFFKSKKIGGAPVVDGDVLIGFCSERDLVFRVLARGRDPHATLVKDVMSKEVVTASPDESIPACEAKLLSAHCRHLPIVENGRVVACVSMRDFLQSDVREREEQLHALTEYIRSAGA
jgi:CBS domain-containing protein